MPEHVMSPEAIQLVIPSRLQVGEPFAVKVKVLGPLRDLPPKGAYNTPKPSLYGPFNLNVQRQIRYVDNVLPEWTGQLRPIAETGLTGPAEIVFDGRQQGVFPGDRRPIRVAGGFAWREPGMQFLGLTDPESGLTAWSNPTYVTAAPPDRRLAWGDPHWQTFFSDGIRCPEELYAFARDEAFLDFGAISDHMEAVTDRQWDYFQAVTNDFNVPGRFVTLQGQEWTHHDPAHGAPGHRNIYYRGRGGPVLRSNAADCNTLDQLWACLDAFGKPALAIPHHPANRVMGVDWDQGWNPLYEKAVEIYSVWGSSERPEAEGNTRPIRALQGERAGRHVRDALRRGYRLGFVGGGDVHDGRAGEAMHRASYPPGGEGQYPQGWTAAWVPALRREAVFDAIRDRQTYATTASRTYLDVAPGGTPAAPRLLCRTASAEGLASITVVRRDGEQAIRWTATGERVFENTIDLTPVTDNDFVYLRVTTVRGNMAWSSPLWRDAWH